MNQFNLCEVLAEISLVLFCILVIFTKLANIWINVRWVMEFLPRVSNFSEIFTQNNTNPILSDSEAALKFEFCMLKNTTQADFQLKISTPGIVATIRSFGKKVMKLQSGCKWISKIPLRG